MIVNKNFFEIKNVTFKVGGQNKVNNVSFSIEKEGDIICLLGPSGIGKTTILRSIAGLENIQSGEINLKGKTLSSNKTNVEPEDILIEHTSANPTGPFHMGRARNPIIGDSIARLLSYYGHRVNTEYYVNDTGRQAATLAYGLSEYETKGEEKVDHRLVECYRKASDDLKNNPNVKEKIYKKMELIESGDKSALKNVKDSAKKMLKGMNFKTFTKTRIKDSEMKKMRKKWFN